jgi:DDE family transposase
VICHSEKQSATPTYKKTFGYHPLFCFLDGTREALSGMLREGRAGSNTTADHITVLDQALQQIPDVHRYGTPILIRSDSAGCTHGFLTHIRSLRQHGVDTCFSVGVAITEPVREAIRQATDWIPALDSDGDLRDGAEICEITGLVPVGGYPTGTRFIVRRERPHPGAQLSLFDTIEGMRHQVMATDTPPGNGSIQYLETRHRAHASRPDSPDQHAEHGYASPKPGPGQQNSPQRSTASPHCHAPSDTAARPATHRTEEPDHSVGPSPRPPRPATKQKINKPLQRP